MATLWKAEFSMTTWYDGLSKPAMTPPKKIFGPVWAGLYLLIAISLTIYFLTPAKPYFIPVLILLAIHFTAGFSWTSIFFGRKRLLAALLDLLFMDATLALIMVAFIQTNHTAALLLIPYCCWCMFATYLNWGILRLNPKNDPQA
ncbi:MAG: tryptophan-rich sensory protein [Chlorobiaceae bacterium]|nr:tryptophan-rich sensory protein [Chlorobiaceae bacterium]